jgi:hypothetical protein
MVLLDLQHLHGVTAQKTVMIILKAKNVHKMSGRTDVIKLHSVRGMLFIIHFGISF